MVILELQGGLGNQLFQYAAGRGLAAAAGATLTLDRRLLRRDPKRRYALDSLKPQARVMDSTELPRPGRFRRWAAAAGLRTGSLRNFPFDAPFYAESDAAGTWDAAVSQVRPPAILRGYFQSPRYFENVALALRSELVAPIMARPGVVGSAAGNAIAAAGSRSVSVHLRRGDYVTEPQTQAVHGVLTLDYYAAALDAVRRAVPDPQLFVFTDDPAAVGELSPLGLPVTLVSGQGLSDLDELGLMAGCTHHVIANSSYSWWGAWLGTAGGVTVAPRRWFAKPSEAAIRDRFPAHWHVVG